MKVVLTLNELKRDGMGTVAITLIRALRAQGIAVQPIHAWNDIGFQGYWEDAKPIIVRNGPIHLPITDDVKLLAEKLNEICEDGDVVINCGSPNWLCTIPYLRPKICWITAVHSINPSTIKLCLAYKERVSAWVCISKGVMDRFLKKLPKQYHHKVHLICNAVANCEQPKTDYETGDVFKILYVGRIEDTSKGCGKIPKILAELKRRGVGARCDFYGYFHSWERQFWAAVDKANVREMVKYCGEITHEDMYSVMPKYDAFLAPSNFEGFPLSTSEAMMCGLPCVLSKIKGVTDWICDYGKAGIVVPKMDIKAFAAAIETLAKDAVLREGLGRAGRARIMELASFEAHGKKYAELAKGVSCSTDYQIVAPHCPLENYRVPEFLKPWGPARVLPSGLKSWLRRFM